MASSSSRTIKIMYRMSGCLRLQLKMIRMSHRHITLENRAKPSHIISIPFVLYLDNPQLKFKANPNIVLEMKEKTNAKMMNIVILCANTIYTNDDKPSSA